MGRIRAALDRAVIGYCTDNHGAPAADRRTASLGGMLAGTAADAGHPAVAAVVSGLGAAAIAADTLFGHPTTPEDGYAGFTADAPKRGWRR